MARPPLTDRSVIKASSLKLRLTKEEHEKLSKAAASQGMTLSQWVRTVLNRAARTG